jgi:hypothetical protein
MTQQKEPSAAFAVFGLVLFIVSGMIGELILWQRFGWEVAALPACLAFGTIGFRIAWPPADGNAGARGSGAGAPYVIQLDPEDPDAGIPRRPA